MNKLLRSLVAVKRPLPRRRLLSRVNVETLEQRTLLAAQLIASDATMKSVSAGETIDIPVIYQTLDGSDNPAALQTNLISFNLHFDADALTYVESTSIFAEGLQVVPNATRSETDQTVIGDDNDAATDTVLVASYSDTDFALSLGWPNSLPTAGQTLYVARFTAKPGFTGSTINFSANATGNVIGQGQEFTFQSSSVTLETPADLPQITAPMGTSDDVRPIVTWTGVTDATSYDVFVERLETGANTTIVNTSTANTSFPLTQDLGIGRYRAWVRAALPAGKTVWTTSDFQVSLASTLTPLPFYGEDLTPTISWTPVAGASSYRVYVGNVTSGDAVVDETVVGTSYTPTTDFEFGRHQIWVRAIGPQNYPSAWSDVVKYYIGPDLLAPTTSTFNLQPEFSWTSVPGIASYRLFVQKGSTTAINEASITGTSFTPASPLEAGAYRWWILPSHANGRTGAWSELGEFFAGGRPTVTGPVGTTNSGTPTITWGAVEGAGSYEVYLFNDDGLGLRQRVNGITGSSFTTIPVPDGNYRVWVKSYKANGDSGLWSRPMSFVVDAASISTTATPTSPVTPTFDTTPTFTWNAAGANSVDLYLTDGQTVITQNVAAGGTWTPTAPLAAGTWDWWVRAKNAAGAAGPWSSRQTTDTSGRAVVLAPTGTTSDLTPTISWTPVTGASQYVFLLDNVSTGQNSLIRDNSVSGTTYTPAQNLTPGIYRAWVRAINGANNQAGPWSFPLEFTVAAVESDAEGSDPEILTVSLSSVRGRLEEVTESSREPRQHVAGGSGQAADAATGIVSRPYENGQPVIRAEATVIAGSSPASASPAQSADQTGLIDAVMTDLAGPDMLDR